MHVCFRGVAGDGKVARSIGLIRGLTKNMKAMSLNVKVSGGGDGARARRRRPEAEEQQLVQDQKEIAGAASALAKVAPAQLQEEADAARHDHELQRRVEGRGGGKKREYCDKCCSPLLDDDGAAEEEDEVAADEGSVREWVAEPEPGVLMTLAPRPDGTNRLRRMRFREELFDAWAAQSWWADNYDRIVELYSVVQSDDDDDDGEGDAAAAAALPATPCQSEDEEERLPNGTTIGGAESGSPSTSNFSGEPSSGSGSAGTLDSPILGLVTAPNTSTRTAGAAQDDDDDGSIGEQARTETWREWVEEYEAGVFITVRAYPDHPLQLRRVELSRERFGEVKARVWWQENKDRLYALYPV